MGVMLIILFIVCAKLMHNHYKVKTHIT